MLEQQLIFYFLPPSGSAYIFYRHQKIQQRNSSQGWESFVIFYIISMAWKRACLCDRKEWIMRVSEVYPLRSFRMGSSQKIVSVLESSNIYIYWDDCPLKVVSEFVFHSGLYVGFYCSLALHKWAVSESFRNILRHHRSRQLVYLYGVNKMYVFL